MVWMTMVCDWWKPITWQGNALKLLTRNLLWQTIKQNGNSPFPLTKFHVDPSFRSWKWIKNNEWRVKKKTISKWRLADNITTIFRLCKQGRFHLYFYDRFLRYTLLQYHQTISSWKSYIILYKWQFPIFRNADIYS